MLSPHKALDSITKAIKTKQNTPFSAYLEGRQAEEKMWCDQTYSLDLASQI